jgi:hypothetical protein
MLRQYLWFVSCFAIIARKNLRLSWRWCVMCGTIVFTALTPALVLNTLVTLTVLISELSHSTHVQSAHPALQGHNTLRTSVFYKSHSHLHIAAS